MLKSLVMNLAIMCQFHQCATPSRLCVVIKKSDYSVRKWRDAGSHFGSVCALKRKLKHRFSEEFRNVEEDTIEMGFIEPGHGAKGRQQWLVDDDDLADMYKAYNGEKEILLLAYLGGSKRLRSQSPEAIESSKRKKTKYDAHTRKMCEVEEIVDDLHDRHGTTYTQEQYNVWAHMINLRKHNSRDKPPEKPFFRGPKKKHCASADSVQSSLSRSGGESSGLLPTGISPGKRIQLRSQSMQQLEMWHSLYEKGAVEDDEYRRVQANILSDIKHF